MGHRAGPRGLVRAPLLAISLGASLLLVTEPAFADDSPTDVDSLWNQPEAVSVDSGWYFIQAGWDQAALAVQHDPTQHSLAELARANADLLNAYSLLAEARTDPGPHPVPLVDPLLSSLYGTVTGVRVSAPLGSLFSWLNQTMLTIEGRGSSVDIAGSLLRDFGHRLQAADHGLPQAPGLDDLWVANSQRQQTMLAKVQVLAAESPDAASLTALVTDVDHQRQDLLKHHTSRGDHGNIHGHQDRKP